MPTDAEISESARLRQALHRIIAVCNNPGDNPLRSVKELAERGLADVAPRAATQDSVGAAAGALLDEVSMALAEMMDRSSAHAILTEDSAPPEPPSNEEAVLLGEVERLLARLSDIRDHS